MLLYAKQINDDDDDDKPVWVLSISHDHISVDNAFLYVHHRDQYWSRLDLRQGRPLVSSSRTVNLYPSFVLLHLGM